MNRLKVINKYRWDLNDEIWSGFYWSKCRLYIGVIHYLNGHSTFYKLFVPNQYNEEFEYNLCIPQVGELLNHIHKRIKSIELKDRCAIIYTANSKYIIAHIKNSGQWEVGNWVVTIESLDINSQNDITLYKLEGSKLRNTFVTLKYKALIVSLINVIAYDYRAYWF